MLLFIAFGSLSVESAERSNQGQNKHRTIENLRWRRFRGDGNFNECLLGGQSFSLINCNIRSLSANFDKLSNMLSELYFPFSLIGLTEIKQKINQPPISNTDLCGYQFLSQPSISNAGGVAFYINNNLNFNTRPEFTTTADDSTSHLHTF